MGTKNRRVAAYLPQELDDRLKAFIVEQNLKGESAALIAILSEFFGITHSVAHSVDYSAFVRLEQFQELSEKVSGLSDKTGFSELDSKLLSELNQKIERIESQIVLLETELANKQALESTPFAEPAKTDSSPGQMALLDLSDSSLSDSKDGSPEPLAVDTSSVESSSSISTTDSSSLSSKLPSELPDEPMDSLKPMTGYSLSDRFGLSKQAVANSKSIWKDAPEKFIEWTKKKDPEGVAWQYNTETKLYCPIFDSSPVGSSSSPV